MSAVDAPLTLGPSLLRNINAESKRKLMARGAWVHELYALYYSDLKLYQDRSTFFPGGCEIAVLVL